MWTITINNRAPVTLDTEEVGWESLVNAINANPELNGWLTAEWGFRPWPGSPPTMRLSNPTSGNVRVKMVNDQWTQEWEEIWAGSLDGNPTAHQSVSEDGVYELMFCLSAAQTISCVGATPYVSIITTGSGPDGDGDYTSDIEVFVNGVSRGIWPCSENTYATLEGSIPLPELTFMEHPNWGGLSTTITNTSNEPVRLELRAIDAPTHRGGLLLTNLYQNPTALCELQGDNVSLPHPEGTEPWDILKVCLAPADDGGPGEGGSGDCTPTTYVFDRLDEILSFPTAPRFGIYYKLRYQRGNLAPVETRIAYWIWSNSTYNGRAGYFFARLLSDLSNYFSFDMTGSVTQENVNGDGTETYTRESGQFKLIVDEAGITIQGYTTEEGNMSSVPTTITFLEPTQEEMDDFGSEMEIPVIDAAYVLFNAYPTWHSCSIILAA